MNPSEIDDWKEFEKINVTIALNFLYSQRKKHIMSAFQLVFLYSQRKKIYHVCVSKHNSKLMPLYSSKESISIIKRSTSKYNGDFYCLNYLHSFRTKNKLDSH